MEQGGVVVPKLYGELITDSKMRVDIVSYSGNRQGGVEVGEVLEGEGVRFVNPETKEQWYEVEGEDNPLKASQSKNETVTELKAKLEELQAMVDRLVGE